MKRVLWLLCVCACTDDLADGEVVQVGDIAIEVPAPGERAGIAIERDDGTFEELQIENRDGVVQIVVDDGPVLDTLAASSTAPCNDGAYHLAGHHWTTDYHWLFQAGSTPSANSKDNVEDGLRNGANAITHSRNDCGLADTVSATNSYGGRTSKAPNIKATTTGVTCGARDQTNVVGFGALPTSYLAVACWWADGDNHTVEGDVRISTKHRWFALDVPSGCSSTYSIQGVSTHEFGHVFGMAHVSESTHPNLTMSTAMGPCTNASLSLGLGDVRGLRAMY